MSRIKQIIHDYFSSKNILFEMFEEDGWETIENYYDRRWCESSDGLQWLNDDGDEYFYDYVRKCGNTIDGIELYYVQDNGERFYIILSTKLKLDEEEYEKEIGEEL